ncbi:hypothetical protein IP84_12285 [beta proteobacterium AAP99]|nr:hypothetical protein IP84_12285 [beta proteobacterium AAP99]
MRRGVWRDRLQNLAFLGALLAAAAWTGWLALREPRVRTGADAPQIAAGVPDYIIENLTMTRLSASGMLTTQFVAPRLTHFPTEDRAVVESPRVVSIGKQAASTQIASRTGEVLRGGEEIVLLGDVAIQRDLPAAPGARAPDPQRLSTQRLHLFPDTEIMRTTEPVSITQGPRAALAREGMQIDGGQRHIEFTGPTRMTVEASR